MSIAPASLWNSTAAEIKDLVASTSPTPGGGSVSVIAASLGLALLHKGVSVSLKRTGEDDVRRQRLIYLSTSFASTMDSLSRLADEDADAFQSFIKARGLPHTTEDENTSRKTSMDKALLRATQIPVESAVGMVKGLALAETAMDLAETNVLSDIFAGVLLLHASIKAVLLNVDANLPGIQDAELHEAIRQQRAALEDVAALRAEAIASNYRLRAGVAETA